MTANGTRHGDLLVVEDNPGDADLVAELLSEGLDFQLTIHHAPDLAHGVAWLQKGGVDALLLDLGLPDGSGVECVDVIRHAAPTVPIVILTGLDDEATALACLDAGAQDYLPKNELSGPGLRRAIAYARARMREATERTRADALQSQLAAIVGASRDAIVSSTVAGVVTSWNEGAREMFGHTAEEAVGRHVHEVMVAADGEGELRRTERRRGLIHGASQGRAVEMELRRKDSTLVSVSVMSSVLRDSGGNVIGVADICRDITERERVKAQLLASDRMASLGILAAGVAHEINNPLAAVVANLELATEDLATLSERVTLPETLLDTVSDAREGAARIRTIARDLRVFSRVEAEQWGPVDVEEILESSLRMCGNEVRHRARVVRDFGAVPRVHASESRLGQVFLNLVINAAHAIPEGNQSANEIRLSTSLDDRGRVVVTIADTGVGIPREVQDRVFAPFFTTKPRGVGTGLGLPICKQIVADLDGELTFESQVGVGTRFYVTLPLAKEAVAAPVVRRPRPSVKRSRVLVIDDEPAIGVVVGRILTREHDVTLSDSAAAALARLRSGERYDAILCDLMMPQKSGIELYEELMAIDAGQARRVVFVTGGAFTPRSREFLESIPNPRLDKPFNALELRDVVNRIVGES